jgi:hypothetical protein
MWHKVSQERYNELLEILPPAHQTQKGFLVGEPTTHRKCKITGQVEPTYAAFIKYQDQYFEGPDLTVEEFNCLNILTTIIEPLQRETPPE